MKINKIPSKFRNLAHLPGARATSVGEPKPSSNLKVLKCAFIIFFFASTTGHPMSTLKQAWDPRSAKYDGEYTNLPSQSIMERVSPLLIDPCRIPTSIDHHSCPLVNGNFGLLQLRCLGSSSFLWVIPLSFDARHPSLPHFWHLTKPSLDQEVGLRHGSARCH